MESIIVRIGRTPRRVLEHETLTDVEALDRIHSMIEAQGFEAIPRAILVPMLRQLGYIITDPEPRR